MSCALLPASCGGALEVRLLDVLWRYQVDLGIALPPQCLRHFGHSHQRSPAIVFEWVEGGSKLFH